MTKPSPFQWPPPVRPGDRVAVAAPASPVDREAFQAGVHLLEDWGLTVVSGLEIFADRAWGRKADVFRARRFMELWRQPGIAAIIGARGGYGSLKVLPHLNYAALAASPKRLVGFSDLTNLLWSLHHRLQLITFHGPNVAHLPHLTPGAREDFFAWLASPGPREVNFPNLTVLHPGQATGPLAGGNLTTLCHLLGTPFAPQFAGCLLFLEDHNEALYRLDRLVHHLLLSGALTGARGVVLGAFTNSESQDRVQEVLGVALQPLGVPVLAGLPAGHQPDNYTLPLGTLARLDAATASLTISGP